MGCSDSSEKKPSTAEAPAKHGGQSSSVKQADKAAQKSRYLESDDWPWSRPHPQKLVSTGSRGGLPDFFYSKVYLNSFKILNAVEAKAYEAYQNEELELAREILKNGDSNATVSPHEDMPLSPVLSPMGGLDIQPMLERTRGGSVSAEANTLAKDKGPTEEPKTPRTMESLTGSVRRCPLFSHLSSNFNEHEKIASAMTRRVFEPGEVIYSASEVPSEELRGWYVVMSGKGLIKRRAVKEVRMPGDFFGEMMVNNTTSKSPIDVKAAAGEKMVAYCLSPSDYSQLVAGIAHRKRVHLKAELTKVKFADTCPFAEMTEGQLAQLADCLVERHYLAGQHIIKYGEPGRHAHIILKGTVHVVGRKSSKRFKVCEFREGEDPVGFLEFFNPNGEPDLTIADVIADPHNSAGVTTACISREQFERCMGPIKELLHDVADHSNVYEYYRAVKQKALAEK